MKTLMVSRAEIVTREPFISLFPVDPAVVSALIADMRTARGFDAGCPMRVWATDGALVMIDGHMRLTAADAVVIDPLPVQVMEFENQRAALRWAFTEQAERRRNLTDAQRRAFWSRAVEAMDKPQPHGGDRKSTERADQREVLPFDSSAIVTAGLIGASDKTVKDLRAIHQHHEITAAVRAGKLSIENGGKQARAKAKTTPADKKKTATKAIDAITKGRRRLAEIRPDGQKLIENYSDEIQHTFFQFIGDPPSRELVRALLFLPDAWLKALLDQTPLPKKLDDLFTSTGNVNLSKLFPGFSRSINERVWRMDESERFSVVEALRTVRPADHDAFLERWIRNGTMEKVSLITWAQVPAYQRPLLAHDDEAGRIWRLVQHLNRLRHSFPDDTNYGRWIMRMAAEVWEHSPDQRWYQVLWAFGIALSEGESLGNLESPPWEHQ